MGGNSKRHQLSVRRPRVAVVLAIAACAVIAAVVMAGLGEPPVSSDNAAFSTGAPETGGIDETAGGDGRDGGRPRLPTEEPLSGEEGAGQSSGVTSVPEVAANLVCEYEQRGDCVLVRSGFLDLSGRVWSMVVEGSGWVDVCIVQRADDGTCETKVMHMDAAEWAASLGELGLGG